MLSLRQIIHGQGGAEARRAVRLESESMTSITNFAGGGGTGR